MRSVGTTRIETFERLGGVSRARGSELSQLVDLSLCVARAGQRWRGWMESEMKWTLKKRAKAAAREGELGGAHDGGHEGPERRAG